MNIKKRNFIIIILLVIGILAFGVTEFYIKPQKQKQEAKYKLEQQYALTHDFDNVLKYKSKYMGNASNIINLNYTLPLCHIPRVNKINSDKFEYTIDYEGTVSSIGQETVKSDLIYNATANFVLIDNLKSINFNFIDISYNITRSDVEKWYNADLASFKDKTKWKKEVQDKLLDKTYVDKFWNINFKEKK